MNPEIIALLWGFILYTKFVALIHSLITSLLILAKLVSSHRL